MIIRFKLFESYTEERELVDQFSSNFIEKYFRKHYHITISDAVQYVDIWRFVDDNTCKTDIFQLQELPKSEGIRLLGWNLNLKQVPVR